MMEDEKKSNKQQNEQRKSIFRKKFLNFHNKGFPFWNAFGAFDF
jgi:hypothetical protein